MEPFHLVMIETCYNDDIFLTNGIKNFVPNILFHDNNVWLDLGKLVFDNANPVLFLVYNALDLSKCLVIAFKSADGFLKEKN